MNNLSNEEKKGIEKIKKIMYMFPESEELKILLTLIETQQKEIEELKKYKEGYKLLSYGLDNYISKDKIKAKIKELKERPNKMVIDKEVPVEYKNIFLDENAIIALQSLLEEE